MEISLQTKSILCSLGELQIIQSGALSAADNMRIDAELLAGLKTDPKMILRFYQWSQPSATFGYFIQPEAFLDLDALKRHDIHIARRPTGGGILFHQWDFTFSFLLPASHPAFSANTLENYAFVNQKVIVAIQTLTGIKTKLHQPSTSSCDPRFCMAHLTQYDVVWGGKKIAGAAQRKTDKGYLHQGSISLYQPNFDSLKDLLLNKNTLLDAMRAQTVNLHEAYGIDHPQLAFALIDAFTLKRELVYHSI